MRDSIQNFVNNHYVKKISLAGFLLVFFTGIGFFSRNLASDSETGDNVLLVGMISLGLGLSCIVCRGMNNNDMYYGFRLFNGDVSRLAVNNNHHPNATERTALLSSSPC